MSFFSNVPHGQLRRRSVGQQETECLMENVGKDHSALLIWKCFCGRLQQLFRAVGKFFYLMLAFRCSRLRIWPNSPLISALNPYSRNPWTCVRVAIRCQFSLGISPSPSFRSSSSLIGAAKNSAELSRHAEISAYVERLSAQDVQVRYLYLFIGNLQNHFFTAVSSCFVVASQSIASARL
jgi:hypothetical protein